MKYFNHFVLPLMALVSVMCSCNGNKENPDPTPKPDPAPKAITLSMSSVNAKAEGESVDITVKSPFIPQVDNPSWIKVTSGTLKDYTVTMTLEVERNPNYEERKATLTFKATGATSATLTVTQAAAEKPKDPDPDPSGWESAANAAKNMGVGWNLGNTLDANSGSIDNMWIEKGERTPEKYETSWGQPVTTRALIHMFKAAGFGAIRVPVTWYPHMGNVIVDASGHWDKSTWTGYDVDPVWMARVKEVVGYVLDEGMYCILNVHHDTGEASTAWLRADKGVYNTVKERYVALWDQIAKEFSSYGERLLFEAFNEMLDAKNTWNYSTKDAHEIVNLFNSDFVATVRATGGNNVHRNLILGTYSAGPFPQGLADFSIPIDTYAGHLLAEVHSYSPYDFAMVEDGKKVFDASCQNEVKGLIENMNQYLVSKGIPCVLGEYGCTANRSESEMSKQAECYVSNAAKYNIPCFYWMVLSDGQDREKLKWTKPNLKNAIIKAYQQSKNSN